MATLKRILRYIKGSTDYRLVYKCQDTAALCCSVDSDWASCCIDRKSTSGYLVKVFGKTIIWSSRKQSLVALSTTEAEYVAATVVAKEILWLQKLLVDLRIQFDLPTIVYEDNFGCIQVSKTIETKRSKHYDIRYHFLKDLVWSDTIKLVYFETSKQLADE